MFIADWINIGLVISALLALYFQARSVRLAERELESQVRDVQSLVEELNNERKERERQLAAMIGQIKAEQDARREESSARVANYVELLNYSSGSYRTVQQITNGIRQIADENIRKLIQCIIVAFHPSTHFSASRDEYRQRFSLVRQVLGALLQLADINDSFDHRLARAAAEYEKLSAADGDAKNTEYNLGHLDADIQQVSIEHGAAVTAWEERYRPLRGELEKLVIELCKT